MAFKPRQYFTVIKNRDIVILCDTTLASLCKRLKEYDSEAKSYHTIVRELKEPGIYTFETNSGVKYVVQRLEKD